MAQSVEIPDRLDEFVRSQTLAGGFASASDFVGAVLSEFEIAQRREKLTQLLQRRMDAADRGEVVEATPEMFENIKRTILERLAAKGSR